MFDEEARLDEDPYLVQLLQHYAAGEDREAWFDRVMQLEQVEAAQLASLHGELIAYGWIEQNTGVVPRIEANACPGCYRATLAGRRLLSRRGRVRDERDDSAAA
jgi:hypothetical protein